MLLEIGTLDTVNMKLGFHLPMKSHHLRLRPSQTISIHFSHFEVRKLTKLVKTAAKPDGAEERRAAQRAQRADRAAGAEEADIS